MNDTISRIDVRGDVAEQMMRYATLLARMRRGETVEAVVSGKWIGDIMPNLPECSVRRMSVAERLRAKMSRSDESPDWMNYEAVEALGDDVNEYFAVNVNRLPQEYASIIAMLEEGDGNGDGNGDGLDETVAVHVLSPTDKSATVTPDYYNWAIAGICSWIEHPHFVVITDDEKWCRTFLRIPEGKAVDWVSLPTSKHELIFEVLRRASHNIICNNLASWWGAWMSKNADKIVIAPKTWSTKQQPLHLIPLYWTIVPVN